MGAIAVPIAPGKLEAWEGFMAEVKGPRKAEFDEMNERMGLTGHRAWLQQTPDGHQMVIAVHDGPGGDEFMGKLATSEHEFDAWFRGKIAEVHGIDFSGPMPPPAEQRL
jgi:hypothetical protein